MTNRRALVTLGLMTALGFAVAESPPKMVWPKFAADNGNCTPPIQNGTLRLGTRVDPKTSSRMKAIFEADQNDRKGEIDWAKVSPRDLAREKEVLAFLKTGKLVTGDELVGAAYVFQHGSCPNHFLLANALAEQAMKLNATGAKWIYAATLDRWLINIGKPQKFGGEPSNFLQINDASGKLAKCIFIELPYDPKTTDAERIFYGYPTKAKISQTNALVKKDFQEKCKDVPKTSQKFY